MKKITNKLLITIALITGFPAISISQVITAPFDITKPVVMPAASGWRMDRGVGFNYRESSGSRELDSNEIYKFESSGYGANGHFKMSNMSLDFGYQQRTNDVTGAKLNPGKINLEYSITRANMAMSGNDFVAVGLGGKAITSVDWYDATDDSETTKESSIGGSIAVKTFDFIYLGGGFERVKQESSFRVNNSWNVTTIGVAAVFGNPGGTQFRTEYSFSSSPHEESDAQDLLKASIHPATTISRFSADLLLNGLLFSGMSTTKTLKHDIPYPHGGETFEKTVKTYTEGGVLWIPPSGLVLGFYFATESTSFFYEDEHSEFRINVAYIFE